MRRYQATVLAAIGLCPLPALAHLISTGFGPVYDGIGHFFLSVEDLLPLLALMAFGGQHGEVAGRRVMFVLPPVWLLGGLFTTLGFASATMPSSLAPVLAIILGAAVALNVQLSLPLLTAMIALVAGSFGAITGSALAAQVGNLKMLLGSTAALCILATLVPALVVKISTEAPWMRITVRVGGSWVAGVGLLMLGWQLRSAS